MRSPGTLAVARRRSGCGARGRVRPRAAICGTSISARRSITPTRGTTSRRSQRLDAELGQYHGLDEPQLDSLHYHIGDAEFSVGDFELNYRMHHRAGRAIKAVLEGDVDEAVRNEAAFRLARIHFQKDQPDDALHALERIEGEVPEAIADDVEFLRANVYMALGRPAEAVEVLERPAGRGEPDRVSRPTTSASRCCRMAGRRRRSSSSTAPGESRAASAAPRRSATSRTWCSARCCSSRPTSARQQSLDRVRLEGPFSNQALLRAGWADVSAQNFERALVPWNILAERELTDAAVQEALLARRIAYSKLKVHGRAALLYGRALEAVRQRARQGRRLDREHPQGRVPEGAGARGDSGRTRTG